MVTANDKVGTSKTFTRRALVLAVASDIEGYSPGDIVWFSRDVDLIMGHKDANAKGGPKTYANPNCQMATYKRYYKDEDNIGPCAEIFTHQVKAVDSSNDFIFQEKVGDSYMG